MNYLSHGIVAAGLLCLAGCGPSADEEANIKDFLKTAQEMNQVMNTVRDDKTAERAGPRFNEVAGRMLSLLGRAQGFSKAHGRSWPRSTMKNSTPHRRTLATRFSGCLQLQAGRK